MQNPGQAVLAESQEQRASGCEPAAEPCFLTDRSCPRTALPREWRVCLDVVGIDVDSEPGPGWNLDHSVDALKRLCLAFDRDASAVGILWCRTS